LRHVLVSDEFHACFLRTVAGVGGSLLRARPDGVKEIKVPLPPLAEQKRIAAILDQADSLRRLRQRAIDRLNSLGQAIFYEMFGDPKANLRHWPAKTLGEVAEFYSGNSLPEGEEFFGQPDGFLLLKVSDLNRPENSREIGSAAGWRLAPGSRAGTCPALAVVFPKRGGAIGTNKKRLLSRKAILDPNLMGVVPFPELMHPEFLFGWFNTFNLMDISSGSSVPQLNKQDLAPLNVYLPPLVLQEEYATRINGLLQPTTAANRSADSLRGLFHILQHRAFRGEL
jgi:type I restriction enzyme S subunit